MRIYQIGLLAPVFAQNLLSMGARLHLTHSRFISSTDQKSSLTTLSPTQKVGIIGFFGWGWTPHLVTGIEVGYQGVGQSYYGIGRLSEPYAAGITLHYLRTAATFQPQYAREGWGVWFSFAPGINFLTQTELSFQGDSVPVGGLISPQIIQRILGYLEKSTNPNDRLLLLQVYQRIVPSLSMAGGIRIRLTPQVWILGLLSYERSLRDIEKKDFRLGTQETPLYDPQRKPTHYRLIGFQLGLQYEVMVGH
ncbi:MAG: hypothetical protein RMK19_08285 [Bacteroidia bacterium]|nr:hypothetical protein [Bacteroidia bacterium]MDW8015995.1 hypothetical protein [Bacteroidia bacterium]